MHQANIHLLYVMELLAGLPRGSYLVCIGWTGLVLSDSVAVVGQLFIVQSLTVLLLGSAVGLIVDRYPQKNLIIVARGLIAVSMAAAGFTLILDFDPAVVFLYLVVSLVSGSRLLYQITFDSIIRSNVGNSEVTVTLGRATAMHLFATGAGTIAAGLIIDQYDSGVGFILSALCTALVGVTAIGLKQGADKSPQQGATGFFRDLGEGLRIFRDNRQVQILALLTMAAFPVGQLINAVLSSFIRDDLGLGSDVFGIVDSAWPIGGLLAAILVARGFQWMHRRGMEFLLAGFAGLATIEISFGTDTLWLVTMHGLMGFSVWVARIIANGRIIELCTEANVGRVRVSIEVLFALAAVVMCLTPTIVKLPASADYFFYWGILITAAASGLWLYQRRLNF